VVKLHETIPHPPVIDEVSVTSAIVHITYMTSYLKCDLKVIYPNLHTSESFGMIKPRVKPNMNAVFDTSLHTIS
jgi:hypothetical protein